MIGRRKMLVSEAGGNAPRTPEGTKGRRTEIIEDLDYGLNLHIHPSSNQHPYTWICPIITWHLTPAKSCQQK